MATEILHNVVSAEEMLYLIMQLSPSGTAGQRPKVNRMIFPPSRLGKTKHLVKAPWRIHLRNDARPDAELAIELRGEVTIGLKLNPGDNADIDLKLWQGYHYGISRRHLLLRPSKNSLFAIDLASTNGSMINGMSMAPSRAYPLASGDLLSLGRLHVQVVRVDRAVETTYTREFENEALPIAPRPERVPAMAA